MYCQIALSTGLEAGNSFAYTVTIVILSNYNFTAPEAVQHCIFSAPAYVFSMRISDSNRFTVVSAPRKSLPMNHLILLLPSEKANLIFVWLFTVFSLLELRIIKCSCRTRYYKDNYSNWSILVINLMTKIKNRETGKRAFFFVQMIIFNRLKSEYYKNINLNLYTRV